MSPPLFMKSLLCSSDHWVYWSPNVPRASLLLCFRSLCFLPQKNFPQEHVKSFTSFNASQRPHLLRNFSNFPQLKATPYFSQLSAITEARITLQFVLCNWLALFLPMMQSNSREWGPGCLYCYIPSYHLAQCLTHDSYSTNIYWGKRCIKLSLKSRKQGLGV